MADRSLLLFHNAIKSRETQKIYDYCLKRFLEFAKIKESSGLLQLKTEALQEMVEDYVMHLKKSLKSGSIEVRISAIQLFFEMNRKVLDWKMVRRLFPERLKPSGDKAWTNLDIGKMLELTTSYRNKAIIHFLASTGCRIGALAGLRLKHISSMPDYCEAALFYEGTKDEYTSFLTPEASKVLDKYLNKRSRDGEYLNPESPVFRTKYMVGVAKVKPMSEKSIKGCMFSIISKIRSGKEGKRYNIQTNHGFRKRFNTILKNNKEINISVAERLMGHFSKLVPLDTVYYNPSRNVLFTEFRKAISDLTIDDSERNKTIIAKLETEKSDLEKKTMKIAELEETLSKVIHKLDVIEKTAKEKA
jgi:integrase/recombinase XerD